MAVKKKYNLEKLRELVAEGSTIEVIADYFGVTPRTIMRRKLDDKEFICAYNLGKQDRLIIPSDLLIEKCRGGSVKAMRYLLDRKCGWSETKIS